MRKPLPELGHFFPGVTADQTPDGAGFAAAEWVTLTTHNGTHLDAPWHFHPTMDGGKRAITIDEVPLEWCFNPGVKLDFRHFDHGYVATAADVEAELARIGHDLQPFDIVLVNTAAGLAVGNPDYVNIGCGMGYEATMYLLERGIRVTGTDAWSWDAPFSYTAKKVAETGDNSLIWEGHKADATSVIVTSKSCTTLKAFLRTASPSVASRTRSVVHRQAGRALSQSSKTDRAS
jgi:kynurenine formamidase